MKKIQQKQKTKKQATKATDYKQKKYHTVGIVPNSTRLKVKRESKSTHIHCRWLPWVGTGTSIKAAGLS